jgi:hypothetical protein
VTARSSCIADIVFFPQVRHTSVSQSAQADFVIFQPRFQPPNLTRP